VTVGAGIRDGGIVVDTDTTSDSVPEPAALTAATVTSRTVFFGKVGLVHSRTVDVN
jgi:hypothetical protein